jgi:hypothetical protein
MRKLSFCLLILLSYMSFGLINFSFAKIPLPPSELKDNVEIFQINCPGNPKVTTIDMNNCFSTMRENVKAIEAKYVNMARQHITSGTNTAKEQDHKTLMAFEAENKAWGNLISAASNATETKWDEGTIRGVKGTSREIQLIEQRIHNQWDNWLRYEDSTPPVLPEPKFNNTI